MKKRERAKAKMCSRKKRFSDRLLAKQMISKITKRGGPKMRYYQCPYCKGWHITRNGYDYGTTLEEES